MLLVVLIASLSGCSSPFTGDNPETFYANESTPVKGAIVGAGGGAVAGYVVGGPIGAPVGAGVGLVLGGVIGKYLDHHETLVEKLQSHGVKIIRLGDYVKLVVPSAQLFVGMSDQLTFSAKGTLGLIAKMLSRVKKITVMVSAFGYQGDSKKIAIALSTHQAIAVANFLSNHGVDARLLMAQGYGGAMPIVSADSASGENYRVEITLRELNG